MAEYSVAFARSARSELEQLDAGVAQRVISRIEALGSNPRPLGCVKLQGTDDLWRSRIGDYRAIYAVDDHTHVVDISAVRHRSDACR